MGEQVWRAAEAQHASLLYCSYDALLRLRAGAGSARAADLYADFKATFPLTEATVVSVLSACAESASKPLADRVVADRRASGTATVRVFAAQMKVYASMRLYAEACTIFETVREDGLAPDDMMRACVLSFAARAGRQDLVDELSEAGTSLPAVQHGFMARIRLCRAGKDGSKALRVLEEMKQSGVADQAAYNAVLDVCTLGDVPAAAALLAEMRGSGLADEVAFNTLVKGYSSVGSLEAAKALMQEMRQAGVAPTECTYNALLNGLVRAREFRAAAELSTEIREAGLEDGYTLSTLLKAVKSGPDASFTQHVLHVLDTTEVSVVSDSVVVSVVLDALVRLKDRSRLSALVAQVQASGSNPPLAVVNLLIKSLNALGRLAEAKVLWQDLVVERAITPSEVTMGCYVDALCSNHALDEAIAFAQSWRSHIAGNCIIYSTLLKGCAKERDVSKALRVYEMMREDGVTPNTVTLNCLLDTCARGGAMQDGERLFQELRATVTPDRITYATMLKGYAHSGQLDAAAATLQDMTDAGIAIDVIAYNTLLDGAAGHDAFARCDEVFARMLAEKVQPTDYTLQVMIKRHGREGQLAQAEELLRTLPAKYGFAASTRACTCLLSACVANGALGKAVAVVERMAATGPPPDGVTYERIVHALLRAHDAETALRLLRQAVRAQVPLQPAFLETVVHTLPKLGHEGEVVPLVQALRAGGCAVPRLVAASLRR